MLSEVYVYVYLTPDGWVPCGLLQFQAQGRYSQSVFRYGVRYLERSNAISIDPVQLPLTDREFNTEEGFSIFNGIRDAGPDKWGRYLLDKKFQRPLNELEYTIGAGVDRVGALGFSDTPITGPKSYTPKGFTKPSEDKAQNKLNLSLCAAAAEDAVRSENTERLRQYLQYGPSLGGARPKAAVTWNGEAYLAKFSVSLDTRDEPTIEYATMTLAKKCGLKVPELLLESIDGKNAFLIKRFDRRPDGTPIPFVSGLTLTGLHESDYSSWSYHLLVDALMRHSGNVEEDLTELFKRMVFNILVYNNDDHPRNFGFLHQGKQFWGLSPLYDVVPTTVTTQTYSLAMAVGLEGKKASIHNALSLASRFRLTPAQASSLTEEIRHHTKSWKDHFQQCGVSRTDIALLENSFADKP